MKKRLFTPGPTDIPDEVQIAMTLPTIHHRHEEFIEIFKVVLEDLRYAFQTKSDVLVLTSSGTGALESAVVNCVSRGDTPLVIEMGKFSERWTHILNAYGVQPEVYKVAYGKSPDPDQVAAMMKKNSSIRTLFCTLSETSTGALSNVRALARVARERDALIIVDGISGLLVHPLEMDEWGLDVVLTGSQKALMLPPGLAFAGVSARAWDRIAKADLPRYYFDYQKARKTQADAQTPWTPANTIILGLGAALKMVRAEGLHKVWERHARIADGMRAGARALGLEIFPDNPVNSLTAIRVPAGIEGKAIVQGLKRRFGFTISGGQGEMKGKVFRIGHLGDYHETDIAAMLCALELVLIDLGHPATPGAGVTAAQEVFAQGVGARTP
ncbi:MAG: pyridoxal-phosphate-dependent aminotransferase family protein [bacterium]